MLLVIIIYFVFLLTLIIGYEKKRKKKDKTIFNNITITIFLLALIIYCIMLVPRLGI